MQSAQKTEYFKQAVAQALSLIEDAMLEGDVAVTSSDSISTKQCLRKLEGQSSASEATINLRMVDGKKYTTISSNDLDHIPELVRRGIEQLQVVPEDANFSLPKECIKNEAVTAKANALALIETDQASLSQLTEYTKLAEEEALSKSLITNSEGSEISASSSTFILGNTRGLLASYDQTYYFSSISVVASKETAMEIGYEYSSAPCFTKLMPPKDLGMLAATMAATKLGAIKVKSCKVPVVFAPKAATEIISSFARAINGQEIAKSTSFLKSSMDKRVFTTGINIIDDPLLPGSIYSFPFDGEGVEARKKNIVENGILSSWILDTYCANKLGSASTGNAIRTSSGSIYPGVSNFYLENSNTSRTDLIKDIKSGFYVTEVSGFGINLASGTYSQGALGVWIEEGSLTYSVNEVTISGQLQEMFMSLKCANDLEFKSRVNSPTLRIEEMTVGGL